MLIPFILFYLTSGGLEELGQELGPVRRKLDKNHKKIIKKSFFIVKKVPKRAVLGQKSAIKPVFMRIYRK